MGDGNLSDFCQDPSGAFQTGLHSAVIEVHIESRENAASAIAGLNATVLRPRAATRAHPARMSWQNLFAA
jgi:hypothetical protein